MDVFYQDKTTFQAFLRKLMHAMELVAPVQTDALRFTPITEENVDGIDLSKNTYLPVKEYFFKQVEVLYTFKGNSLFEPTYHSPERAFFGLRKCDLNGIRHQDMVFEQGNDPYYAAARKNSFLLGYHCKTAPSKYCFCGSLELVDFFDLMFYDKGDFMLIEVGSDRGKELVHRFKEFFTPYHRLMTQEEKKIIGADRLNTTDISKLYDHPDWKKGVDLCLSCGACTALCPTCYCFEIHDEVKVGNPKEGEHLRSWSSCQLPEFTRVAGDHIFREKREERFKHRIYHQLDYFKEKYGIDLCVGCGRCIEGCPTRIDFVEIINDMEKEKSNEKLVASD